MTLQLQRILILSICLRLAMIDVLVYCQVLPPEDCFTIGDEDQNQLWDCADPTCNCDDAFPCSDLSEFYQINNGLELRQWIWQSTIWSPVGNWANTVQMNALAYNVQDGYMYTMKYNAGDNNRIFKITRSGSTTPGHVSFAGTSISGGHPSFMIGDCNLIGEYFISYPTATSMFRVDLDNIATPAQEIPFTLPIGWGTINIADWAFSSSSGQFHGVSRDALDEMVSVDINGVVTLQPISPPLTCMTHFGGAFSDRDGDVFVYCNDDGAFFELKPDDPMAPTSWSRIVHNAIGTQMTFNDGASCPLSFGPIIIPTDSCCSQVLALLEGIDERLADSRKGNDSQELRKRLDKLDRELSQKTGRSSKGELMQNVPNPFFMETTVAYRIHDSECADVIVGFFDLNGKLRISKKGVASGFGQVAIRAGELEAGIYIYTLFCDGEEIDSKRMVLLNE